MASSLCAAIFLPHPSVSAKAGVSQRSSKEAMDLVNQIRTTQSPGSRRITRRKERVFPGRSFGKELLTSASSLCSLSPASLSSSTSSPLHWKMTFRLLPMSSLTPSPSPSKDKRRMSPSTWPTMKSSLASPLASPMESSREGELLMPLPRSPRNNADDVSLHNPLLRSHRMGCGWLGVILEWDGVIVEDSSQSEREAWLTLSQEEGRRPPPTFMIRRLEGMKSEHAISEVLCWSRDPKELRRLAQRKEDIFQELQGGIYQPKLGSLEFLETLKKYKVPIALASTRSRRVIEKAIKSIRLEDTLGLVVAAEDVYRGKPDPEMYMYAAQLLGIIPERCIVIGNSNSSVEAAHDAFMKCIAVSGKHPIYELGAADLAISRLDNLSFVDLKNLADLDSPEFQPPELQLELELEEEPLPQTRISLADRL